MGLGNTFKGHEERKELTGVEMPKAGSKSMISLRIDNSILFEVRTLVAKMKAKGFKASQSTLMEEGFKIVLEKYKDI